jgi:hypothetical protein
MEAVMNSESLPVTRLDLELHPGLQSLLLLESRSSLLVHQRVWKLTELPRVASLCPGGHLVKMEVPRLLVITLK